ncbi:MAG: HAMP domain-containing histidine kinase, partial [Burkholderiaceae bacterium]|nr:HAMP domain-containing histidine kinase [Burkholderiaceae bacterium]
FLTEVSLRTGERRYVYFSYGMAACLATVLLFSHYFVNGYYSYFFGFYPKAGLLHPLHVLQTVVVVNRGLYITYMQRRQVDKNRRRKLQMCIAAVLTYFFAAVDYLCNYGIEFYPPGVVFIAVSLGIFTIAIVRYDLLNPLAIAATVAHEMRTPLLTIRNQARGIMRDLPQLLHGYEQALKAGLIEPTIKPGAMKYLASIGGTITHEVDRANTALDMMLASLRMDLIDSSTFSFHSARECVEEAVARYTFTPEERGRVSVDDMTDFRFYGSDTLLTMVLFNLFKNALHAIHAAGKGEIRISSKATPTSNLLIVMDTGTGVEKHVLSRMFDPFFTTKKSGGSGIGLAFCQRVIASFGGRMRCESEQGKFTMFILDLPILAPDEKAAPPLQQEGAASPARADVSSRDQ